jgi:hypothetical protein
VSDGAMLKQVESDPMPGQETKYVAVTANVVAQSLVLKEPGSITVRVLRGDDLHRVGRLAILQGVVLQSP